MLVDQMNKVDCHAKPVLIYYRNRVSIENSFRLTSRVKRCDYPYIYVYIYLCVYINIYIHFI